MFQHDITQTLSGERSTSRWTWDRLHRACGQMWVLSCSLSSLVRLQSLAASRRLGCNEVVACRSLSGNSSERHAEGARPPRRQIYIYIYIYILHVYRWCLDVWTSQPGQVVTFPLMKYHWEVSSEAQISLRRSRYSGPPPSSAHRVPPNKVAANRNTTWKYSGTKTACLLRIYIYIYIYTYTCVYIYIYTHISLYMWYTYVYIYIYIYIYSHTYITYKVAATSPGRRSMPCLPGRMDPPRCRAWLA